MAIPEGAAGRPLDGAASGLGSIESNLRDLEKIEKRLTILVVAGRNQRLMERVQDMAYASHHQVLV